MWVSSFWAWTGHVGVAAALQDVDGAAGFDDAAEEQVVFAIGEKALRIAVLSVAIGAGAFKIAAFGEHGAIGFRKTGWYQVARRVDRGGDKDEALQPGRASAEKVSRQKQRQPAAHGGANDDLGSMGLAEDRNGFFEPAAHGAVVEGAARGAVAGIIESRDGKALFGAKGVDCLGLDARHHRSETIEPEKPGSLAGALKPGDRPVFGAVAEAKALRIQESHGELQPSVVVFLSNRPNLA